jgi:hypothetical protein
MKEDYSNITNERFLEMQRHYDKCKCERCQSRVKEIDDIFNERSSKIKDNKAEV